MRNRFAARLGAAVLSAGITCMYSPYPCVIYAGEWAKVPGTISIRDPEVLMPPELLDAFCMEDAAHTEEARSAAMACVAALGDGAAAIDECCVDTGFVGDYETAKEIYLASKDWYCGNIGYSMDYIRLADGNVRLVLMVEHGTLRQAYREHLEAENRLKKIASSFSGTKKERASQIFQWACSHISYADDATIESIQDMEPGCVPDYNGIHATAYTAVMDGFATCDGFSSLLLALFELNKIPAVKVQNRQHAYNIAMTGEQWVLYDAASGISGDPAELIRRYGDYYAPERLTYGYKAWNGTESGMGQKNFLLTP